MATPPVRKGTYSELGIPWGWFRVAWSADLKPGDVVPLHYFGKDLVLFRTGTGRAVVLDAFCEHLGAHLGFGGTVREECIVCPFHGWTWTPEGENQSIPYADHVVRGKIRAWRVREVNGIVWAWYHPEGDEPTWEIATLPELMSGEYAPFHPDACRTWESVRVHPLQPVENTADPAHIRFIHGAGMIPELGEFYSDRHRFVCTLRYQWGYGRESTWLTPEGPVDGLLIAESQGLGVITTRYTGIWPTVQITGCTPIDEEHSEYYTAVLVREGNPETRSGLIRHFFREVESDFPIWEHMIHRPHPPLPRLESKIMRTVRAWSRQFLPDGPADERNASTNEGDRAER
jgi:phenylpropionate dioxygenase-like ring-hydroxylating dioxygenase large terminal subunit